MKVRCLYCHKQCNHAEVATANTVFDQKSTPPTFSCVDDFMGIEICQVCGKPPKFAKLISKLSATEQVEVTAVHSLPKLVVE